MSAILESLELKKCPCLSHIKNNPIVERNPFDAVDTSNTLFQILVV
jgi:hypothetical protein